MSPFLFKTNEAVNEGDLDHYHCRLKVVQTYEFCASKQKLEKNGNVFIRCTSLS